MDTEELMQHRKKKVREIILCSDSPMNNVQNFQSFISIKSSIEVKKIDTI